MNREKAIAYLKRKEKKATEEEISDVMKNGKIYGDPIAILE
jgi:hypothetical protein